MRLSPCSRLYSRARLSRLLSLGFPLRSGVWPGSAPQGSKASSTRAPTCANTQLVWAVNLQANASGAAALSLAGAAASPATGGLLLAGDFAGQVAFGAQTLTSSGGTDAFAAELHPDSGCTRALP